MKDSNIKKLTGKAHIRTLFFNPRLPEPLFKTRLPRGGVVTTPPRFLLIYVLKARYESPLSIDTKTVPVALYLTSQ